jgi:hypothetical protein
LLYSLRLIMDCIASLSLTFHPIWLAMGSSLDTG